MFPADDCDLGLQDGSARACRESTVDGVRQHDIAEPSPGRARPTGSRLTCSVSSAPLPRSVASLGDRCRHVAFWRSCSSATADDAARPSFERTTSIAGARRGRYRPGYRDRVRPVHLLSMRSRSAVSTRGWSTPPGTADVPADPQRIVVLDERHDGRRVRTGLVGACRGRRNGRRRDRSRRTLGSGISEIPRVGPEAAPDVTPRSSRPAPDLILGSSPASAGLYRQLGGVAPTVFDGFRPGVLEGTVPPRRPDRPWDARAPPRRNWTRYATRCSAAGRRTECRSQTQASVVRFTAQELEIEGPAFFPGQVLSDVGVQRPPAQRLTETTTAGHSRLTILRAAEGDLIFVLFDGPNGLANGTTVMARDQWLDLGAVSREPRFCCRSDEIWNGDGLTAARAMLADLRARSTDTRIAENTRCRFPSSFVDSAKKSVTAPLWLSGVSVVVRRRRQPGAADPAGGQRQWASCPESSSPARNPRAAAMRETKEETGVDAEMMRLTSVDVTEPIVLSERRRRAVSHVCFSARRRAATRMSPTTRISRLAGSSPTLSPTADDTSRIRLGKACRTSPKLGSDAFDATARRPDAAAPVCVTSGRRAEL